MDAQRSNDSLPQLPEELIEAVLLKAPVETVVRFRCVSNRWRSLISTKRFIVEHLKTSPAASSVIFNLMVGELKQCDVDSPICQQYVKSLLSNRRFGPAVQLNDHVWQLVVGCVDGLVCVREADGVFYFWNPSTRVTTLLPKLGNNMILTPGFGFDESTGEFKVFVVQESQNQLFERKVYSSMSKSWKVLETAGFLPGTPNVSGIFVCGKLHWPRRITMKLDIVSFDIKTEAFDVIELPMFALSERHDWLQGRRHLTLGVLGGHLSSLLGHSRWEVEVWVMEQYGVKQSWTKVVKLQPTLISLSAPFCTGPKGEILFIYGSYFLAYNPRGNVFRFFGYNSSYRGVHHCVKSLVTPDYALTQGLID